MPPRALTASDRSSLIRLASSLPAGSPERKAILAGLTKTSRLLPELEKAAREGDIETFATILFREYGDNADVYLDDMNADLRPLLGEDLKNFKVRTESVINKLKISKIKAEIAASPWRSELEVLGEVFTTRVGPRDVRKIKYQPKISNGKIVSAILEDMGSSLGHMRTSINERIAESYGTTLKKVFLCLEDLGAKLVARGMGPGKPKSWQDYDGWAY